MNEDLHRHLDGELPLEGLEGEKLKEAEAWDRLLDAFRAEVPGAAAPPWLETRVMAEIEALPESGLLRQMVGWLLHPRPVRVSPMAVGLVTAALATVLVMGGEGTESIPTAAPFGGAGSSAAMETGLTDAVVYVQFILDAPGASSVAVAGDFDSWEGSHGLEDLDGDGIWTGRVPVQPGVHAYMFLVDGRTWMTDPRAERYAEDGFGNRNAILAVAMPTT